MFFNKQMIEDYKKSQRKLDYEKFGIVIVTGLSYFFGSPTLAVIVCLISIVWLLSDIQKAINYQNLMKQKDIGLHDLNS